MHRLTLALLTFCIAATTAHAHAVLTPREAPADSYARLAISITHGCDGSPTKAVRIPEGINAARPQPKAGWSLAIKKEKLPAPVAWPHGTTLTERVSEITWTGTLDADHFDDFSINVRLPDQPNKTLYFATLQECERGTMDWSETLEAGQPRFPAPALKLMPKRQPAHAH